MTKLNFAGHSVWKSVCLLLCGICVTSATMKFSIETTWDGRPVAHEPSTIELQPINATSFLINVEGTFFNDPPNPGGAEGQPFMGLWDYEVIELFLANDGNQYVEIEVGPWGQHIVLLLNGVRKVIRHSLPLEYNVVERTENGRWQGRAVIPVDYLPPNVTKMNAYAIYGSDSNRTYEALYPVSQGLFDNPDFHRLEFFRPVDSSGFLSTPVTALSTVWQDAISSAK